MSQNAPRRSLFAGIALLSGSTVVLQIVLTRLYSAIFGHHFAFLAISLSLFGVGMGGVLLYVLPGLVPREAMFARLALVAGGASAASVTALLVLLNAHPIDSLGMETLGALTVIYVTSALPFVLVGIAVAAAIQHAARDVSRLYLIDLSGAAAGGLVAIAALRTGAPRAALIVAVLQAASAVLFYAGSVRSTDERHASGPLVAGFALCAAVLLLGDLGTPWAKLHDLRWIKLDKVAFQSWNELALITVEKPTGGMAWMQMDGSASTAILDTKTAPPLHPDEMAYVLHKERGPVLVIGAGGGRDIVAALKHGQREVYAAEINPIIVNEVMEGEFKDFSGNLFGRPEVHVTVADGRSYVRRSPMAFRNIEISLVDTWAAASVGALALTENSLYTVEAFVDYLDHLQDGGTLTVNRWDAEFPRLLGLASAALRARGEVHPERHFFACSSARSTTLLVKKTALDEPEIRELRRHCRRHHFNEVFAPDAARTTTNQRIVAFERIDDAVPDSPTDFSPPTDDRPFFFYTVPTRKILGTLGDPKTLQTDKQGLLALVGFLVVSVVLSAACLLGPLAFRARSVAGAPPVRGKLRALVFFCALGAGFVFVEVSLVQNLVMYLGHPVYALSTVLVALLLWAGIGSFTTRSIQPEDAAPAARVRAAAAVGVLAVYSVALGPVLGATVQLPFAARLAMTLLLLAPLGLLMGSQAPLGIKLLDARTPSLIAWSWGLNGMASVVATALGTLVALHLGFGALLVFGGVCYLVAAIAVPLAPDGVVEGPIPPPSPAPPSLEPTAQPASSTG